MSKKVTFQVCQESDKPGEYWAIGYAVDRVDGEVFAERTRHQTGRHCVVYRVEYTGVPGAGIRRYEVFSTRNNEAGL